MWSQFLELCRRLQAAQQELLFRKWKDASGTVIKVDVFTNPRFYVGCEDYLYLWQHCATKTMCEAVVEGMGSRWDKVARAERGAIDFSTGSEEESRCLSSV